MTTNKKNEQFWLDDYHVLYENGNYSKIVPIYESTRIEKLNALSRLCIIFLLLALIFDRKDKWWYIPFIFLIVLVLFYVVDNLIKNNKKPEKFTSNNNIIQNPAYEKASSCGSSHASGDIINNDLMSTDVNSNASFYTNDSIEKLQNASCRSSSSENPFMNIQLGDFTQCPATDPLLDVAACNADDEDVKNDMRVNFNHELFRDVDELWEKHNSQRQFYTMPNTTVPTNQTEFARWLYRTPEICKENTQNCLRYEDLRMKR